MVLAKAAPTRDVSIMVNDNVIDLTLTPAAKSVLRLLLSLGRKTSYVKFVSRVNDWPAAPNPTSTSRIRDQH